MTLNNRPAKIGNAMKIHPTKANNGQYDNLTAIAIPITDVMLDERELNSLLGHPGAYTSLFDTKNDWLAPAFPMLKAFALDEKFEASAITIRHGLEEESIRLAPARITKVKLQPCVGGLTAMSLVVTCTPDLDVNTAHLLGRLDAHIDVEIEFGATKQDQQDLPLNQHGEGE